ncbi:unnamed protein product [Hermetia illucens]|uniref:Protein TsetseEP domain-containing protein n=1 Tax=Hermetia illucens TaxID=343691 RepID=A0A7R8UN29_HERIL|nr:uncharacterized protein LOC119651437 [Hermetia illucens]CAD7083831.1 unnamed protein product [Hermetia illucens]
MKARGGSLNKTLAESIKEMKFATILVLGLVAVANAFPQQLWVISNAENIVQNVINQADSDLDLIVNIVKDLTSGTTTKADGIISAAKETVDLAIAGFENTITGLLIEDAAASNCIQENSNSLDNLVDSFEKDVESCSGDLADNINTFKKQVLEDVDDLKSSISQMVDIVAECATDISETLLCTATKAGSIESLISNTLLSAKTAVAAAQQQVVVTVGKIQKCAQKSAEKATDKINQLVANVQQCISEEKEN